MKKVLALLTLLVSVAVAGVAASPASAVKFGVPDEANAYPWVGLMVAFDADGNPLWRCTGSLIEPDLFLTAGHCVSDPSAEGGDPVETIRIWFTEGDDIITTDPQYLENLEAGAENLCEGVEGYPCGGYSAVGTPEALSGWTGQLTIPQTYDLGLVHITEWVDGTYRPTTYGEVAPVGYLDELAADAPRGQGNIEFTVVGYGLQSVKPVESSLKQRMVGTVSFVNLTSALSGGWSLHYSNNPGQGHGGSGGTCFGDSGGPVISEDGLIVAVNSFVLNNNCNGAGFGYRVDTELANEFIFG
jgi:secreted trypsin-like serine protease